MAKHTRIYTRTGDDGTTGLVGGQRVKKHAPRIDAYGTVDELSSTIGLARTALAELHLRRAIDQQRTLAAANELDPWLAWVQDVLFNVGSDLATLPADRWEGMPLVTASDTGALEAAIDRAERDLPPLGTFIHAGGAWAGAYLHQARTICRRAERLVTALAETDPISPDAVGFLNRLSDALFVWSRWINHALGVSENTWRKDAAPPLAAIETP